MLTVHTSPIDELRALVTDADVRRRGAALGAAVVMHAVALWALIVLPPAILPQVERAAAAISVRLYTVAGGADAESDAPLFEPPLAGGRSEPEGGDSGGTQGGVEGGEGASRAEVQQDDLTEPETALESEPSPDPAVDPEAAPADPPEATLEAPAAATTPDGEARPGPVVGVPAPRTPAPSRPARPADPDAPVVTSQPPADAPETITPRPGPPTFADILARAETRLDPDDYRIIVNMGDGVRQTVRESFCLSSSDANRQAFDCPEGPNPDAARLAQFGLMGLGEEAPEFLEDMDRLAFQLSTMGANDSAIRRILLSVQESRRELIEAGPLRRQIGRDSEPENGNDIPGAP